MCNRISRRQNCKQNNMAQGKVTEYFSNRKRGINAVPSKRRKLHNIADVFTEDNVLPAAEISPIEQILPTKLPNLKTKRKLRSTKLPVAEDTAEISTAICDDHHAPCTPSKQVKISNSTDVPVGTGRSKRVRRQNVERKDMLNDNEAGPSYDFSNYDKKKTPCSAKKRLILHVPTTQPVSSMIHNTQATKPSLKISAEIEIKQASSESAILFQPPVLSKPSMVHETKSAQKVALMETSSLQTKLVNSGKLTELQDCLKSFDATKSGKPNLAKDVGKNMKSQNLSQLREELKLFETNKKNVDLSKVAFVKDNEREVKPAPALERFHMLALAKPPNLTLPYKYKLLLELFCGMDTITSMLHNRAETVTFSKLKAAVQTLTKKSFEVSTVGRIKSVYPSAYKYQQEKGLMSNGKRDSGYQLTMEANLSPENDPTLPPGLTKEGIVQSTGRPLFTSSKMMRRKSVFHHLLIDLTKQYHKEFLATLPTPVEVDSNNLTRWHPEFNIDTIPHIPLAALPEPPKLMTANTAQDVLDVARNKLPDRSVKTLELIACKTPKKEKSKDEKIVSNTNKNEGVQSPNHKHLKGVSSSLLDRIRKKESAKISALMTRSPEDDKRADMLSRLPNLARIIRTLFITQKKPALPMTAVAEKVSDSYKTSLGIGESEDHIRILADLLPKFCSIIKISAGVYVKVDRNQDFAMVISKLEKEYEKNK